MTKTYQACLLSGLLISGVAVAQDSSQEKNDSEGMNQKQAMDKDSASAKKSDMNNKVEGDILSNQLVDSEIMNESDDKIGSINNLVMDKDGQVTGLITGVGGFLGMGEKDVALPWDSVDIMKGDDDDHYQVTTSMSKDELKNKEEYKTEDKMKNDKKADKNKEKIDKMKKEHKQKKDNE